MNQAFLAIVVVAFAVGAYTGSMDDVSLGALQGAEKAVTLALKLVGYMAFFLGLMKVAEDGGLLKLLARAIRPLMVRLFPDVPPDHPAMSAMILNIAANMLGLVNAATPLGIKAMIELNRLNRTPGVATNAMVLFLAINTSGLALLPSGVVSLRAAEESADPWGIIGSTLFATAIATVVGIVVAKSLQRLSIFAAPEPEAAPDSEQGEEDTEAEQLIAMEQTTETSYGVWILRATLVAFLVVLIIPPLGAAIVPDGEQATRLREFAKTAGDWVLPSLIISLLLFGAFKGVKVYESFITGAKEGFTTGVMIIPYLVAILSAVGMFRGSGAMQILTSKLGLLTDPIGIPGEVLPMALVRPLSGSGAYGLMTELVQTHGPDSYIGYVATTLQGSTDTTFYVLAVYFGAVGVTKARHAVVTGLSADFAGFIATAIVCSIMFGHLIGG
jgi:spore maturation protein SpmA